MTRLNLHFKNHQLPTRYICHLLSGSLTRQFAHTFNFFIENIIFKSLLKFQKLKECA